MRSSSSSIRTLTIAICLFGLTGSAAAQTPVRPAPPPANTAVLKGDQQFVEDAARSGLAEIEMGKLARDKASKQEVREFARMLVDDHTKANDELQALAAAKHWTLPSDMGPKHAREAKSLEGTPADQFDRAYVTSQVKAHTDVVERFERYGRNTNDRELAAWIDKTLPALRAHLDKARELDRMLKTTSSR